MPIYNNQLMRNNTYKPDCKIVCKDGKTIPFHKLMLILHSKYFESYFSNILIFGDSEYEINVDCTETVFQLITDYIYNGYSSLRYYTIEDYENALKICDIYLFDERIIYKINKKYKYIKSGDCYDRPITTSKEEKKKQRDDLCNNILIDGSLNLEELDINDVWILSAYDNKDGEKLYDPKKRSSFTYYCHDIEIGTDLRNKIIKDVNGHEGRASLKFARILKYIPGSKYEKHINAQKLYGSGRSNGNHLLIRYSKDAEGGDLIVDNVPVITKQLGTETWLHYYIETNIEYNVTELTKGTRYCVIFPNISKNYCEMCCTETSDHLGICSKCLDEESACEYGCGDEHHDGECCG